MAATMAEAETTQTTHVRLDELVKTYPGQQTPAVDGVSLDLGRGQLLALLGPSGCGKTTTLRMIAGLIEPSSGRIEVDGTEVTTMPVHRRGMGMVFQSYALFPHLDVARNVAFGLEMRKVAKSERDRRVAEALDLVHLGGLGSRRVRELSGGQQQRVALARALVVEPSVLLLDEPLSNLDAKLREAMRTEIRDIQHRTGVTTVFVTHDQDEALSMADRIAVMNAGRVEQVGAPQEIYERPGTQFVADFIGRANLLEGRALDQDGMRVRVEIPDVGTTTATADVPVSGPVTVLIRPHRIDLVVADAHTAAATSGLRGTVRDCNYTGELVAYTVTLGAQALSVEALTGFGDLLAPGTSVEVRWRSEDARVLPAP